MASEWQLNTDPIPYLGQLFQGLHYVGLSTNNSTISLTRQKICRIMNFTDLSIYLYVCIWVHTHTYSEVDV